MDVLFLVVITKSCSTARYNLTINHSQKGTGLIEQKFSDFETPAAAMQRAFAYLETINQETL